LDPSQAHQAPLLRFDFPSALTGDAALSGAAGFRTIPLRRQDMVRVSPDSSHALHPCGLSLRAGERENVSPRIHRCCPSGSCIAGSHAGDVPLPALRAPRHLAAAYRRGGTRGILPLRSVVPARQARACALLTHMSFSLNSTSICFRREMCRHTNLPYSPEMQHHHGVSAAASGCFPPASCATWR